MGRPPFPNPAPTKTLQLRRCQGAALRIPSRKHRDLLRRKQASSCGLTRGCHFHRAVKVTFSRCYNTYATTCLSPIILSPLNGQVKMSPHEQGDILFESERVATSGGDFSMYQGRGGVCQSRRAALLERAPDQALEETSARRRGGGSGTRQSRPA